MQNIIRNATSDDLPEIFEIDRQVVGTRADRTQTIIQAIQNNNCRVLVSDSQIMAFGISTPKSFDGMDFLNLLVVHPEHRRRGFAGSLLSDFQENSTTPHCWTSTNASNAGMIELLQKMGWVNSGYAEELDPGDPEVFFSSSNLIS